MKLFICLVHPQSSHVKALSKTKRKENGALGKLNRVLRDALVPLADGTQIAVIGCAEWESEKFAGVSNLNVRTLDMYYGSHRNAVISCHHFILFHTISYHFIPFHTVS